MTEEQENLIRNYVEMKREPSLSHYIDRNAMYCAVLLSEIDSLRSELSHLKEENRWIPVGERLPEKEGIYLVYEPWGYGVNALWFVLGMDGLPNSTTKKEWETVTHWQLLPKGPEE